METSRKLDNVYPARISRLSEDLRFGITYAQSMTVLERLGFAEGSSTKTFGYYLKSLCKLGVPFDRLSVQGEKCELGRYNFCHLIELSLILTLRVYWTLPDAVLDHVRGHRKELYPFYRMAFLEADSGRGAPIKVSLSSGERFVAGVYFLTLALAIRVGSRLMLYLRCCWHLHKR